MRLVVSTSSPSVSVALLDPDGLVLASAKEEAHGNASGVLSRLVEAAMGSAGVGWSDLSLLAADVGPGGFSGVRVGVTMAKTWAFALRLPAAGLSAFDLVSADRTVAIPARRGEWCLRVPGEEPVIVQTLEGTGAQGYGAGFPEPTYPDAARAAPLLRKVKTTDPTTLVPSYGTEPGISQPKRPFVVGGRG